MGVKEEEENADGKSSSPRPSSPLTDTPPLPGEGAGEKKTSTSDVKTEEDEVRKGSDSQFAEHMKNATKGKGASQFARTKSLKEQRQYLPAFASREDLLKVVRENQGASQSCCAKRLRY